jgi:hypothetical protein
MLFIAQPKISGSVADKVFEKLAMAFVNSKWRNRFADAAVPYLPRLKSDHHPICLVSAQWGTGAVSLSKQQK